MLENSHCGLLLDPGLGKTSISLAGSKLLLAKKLVRRVLVVAPLRPVYEVWPQEISEWKDFNKLGLAILHGPKKDKVLRDLQPHHQIVLINPEGFAWLTSKAANMKLLGADMLVVDESSKWKNSTSVRFKAVRRVLHLFKRRYILTGSPRPRNYLDLFGQIYLIDRGSTLGCYVTHYRNKFFYPTGYQMREWAILPEAPEEINRLVAPLVLRLDAKDHLKMPKDPIVTHNVTLPDKVQAEYDGIEDSLFSTLFTQPLVNSAAARAKCAQIANGSVYIDQPAENPFPAKHRAVKAIHTAKVEALAELYEELQGEPLLVSIGYHHDVVAIRKQLGYDVPVLDSSTTNRQAAQYVADWNAGKLPLLLGHPASMGHGLNMQKCNCRHVAFFDLPDDYDLYDQFFRRVWRQGNKAPFVMRHHFITRRTVDVAKMKNLNRKGTEQRDFLRAMKEYAEEKRR